MNVRLAAQVLTTTVADALADFVPVCTRGTATFCKMMDGFFDCLNVRVPNTNQLNEDDEIVNKKRKPFIEPFKSMKDECFEWLKDTFLKYFEDWRYAIETQLSYEGSP